MDIYDIQDDLKQVLFTSQQIKERVAEVAADIDRDYEGEELLLVGILKGAAIVMADLSKALHLPITMDWMAVSSYGDGTESSGVVRMVKDLDVDLRDKRILIVEDIIDSGLTLSWLLDTLKLRSPKSIDIFSLLRKPEAAKVAIDARYICFDIPNEFVVGYGLDYAEKYRNLDFVGILADHVYS